MPTPSIVICAETFHTNLRKLAGYVKEHGLRLRPHSKTHKSTFIGKKQMEAGAIGMTVAKAGEAAVMAEICDDLLMAYPAVDPFRCHELAVLARNKTVRVGIDSRFAAEFLALAAKSAKSVIGILVDIDVGLHRTGVQSPEDALKLARHVTKLKELRLGISTQEVEQVTIDPDWFVAL